MKKVAVIQDLSSFGKCSLTAAIPVLSVMGIQACPLPTAILSAQSEYPSFYCEDLTAKMPLFEDEWKKLHVSFDGIHTGYITGKDQITHILSFLESFYNENTLLLVDPVMGDIGEVYTNFDHDMLARMKVLAKHADVITPNLTECCLLTGLSYDTICRYTSETDFLEAVREAGQKLQHDTGAQVVLTGIHSPSVQKNSHLIGNMYIDNATSFYSPVPFNGKSYSGTGDLFASVLMGSLMRGQELSVAISLAEKFLSASIQDTDSEGSAPIEGVNFERFLSLLL
ncbi:pyridoxamine kinase [Sporosarcina sp. CAU 1771]